MEGTLEQAGLTQVFRKFRSGRKSGVLQLDRDGVTKRVYFKDGDIVFARSDVGTDRLGELLVRNGRLKRSELELACKVRESSPLRLGKTLVEMGYVSEDELDATVKSQVEGILGSLVEEQGGSYRAELREEPLEETDEDLLRDDIATENVLLQSVRGLDDADAIRDAIGDLSGALCFARDSEWVGANLSLTPQEGFVLSRVDGTSSAAEIAQLSPMGEDETLRCICALIVAGVLELESAPESASAPETTAPEVPVPPEPPPKPATPPARPREKKRPAKSMEPPPKPMGAPQVAPEPPPRPENPAPVVPLSPEAREFQEEMLRKHSTAHEVTYYELLDVTPTASLEEIKAAYFRLAKRLHPDHRAGLRIQDPDGVFDDLYLAIKAAYEVLSNEAERRRYDFTLEKAAPSAKTSSSSSDAETSSRSAGPAPTYDAGQMARLHFSNGQRFFNEARFHEAIEELQDAVRLDGERPEYHRLLGHALAKNPKWRRRAEGHYLRVLELDRFDIDTMLALGEVYEAGGMERRARKMYEEALGLDPGNERALEKLAGDSRGTAMDRLKGILHRTTNKD